MKLLISYLELISFFIFGDVYCIEPLSGSIKLAGEIGGRGYGDMGIWGDWGYFYTFFPILFHRN
ncbi:MAG: hypothetical protein AB4080_11250, partial [Trichodesmium sp.]